MTSRINIRRPGGATAAGTSFDAEMAPAMWHRTRLIFWVGLVASAIFVALNRWYEVEAVSGVMDGSHGLLHLVHPLSFLLGLLAVHAGPRTLGRIRTIAFLTIAFNLLLVIPSVAHFYPQHDTHLAVGLMLFVTAAFLPWPAAQLWLAVEAVALAVLVQTAGPAIDPAVGAYWESLPDRSAFFEHVWRPVGVTVIAGASVLVSRTLYQLHRSAHRAKRLGNYVIERDLGAGGMGKVYLARHALICRPTAVKVMTASEGDGPATLGRFEREVQLSASLTHPNTITIFDFGRTEDDTFYYAMEYLEGLDLESLVERFGPLPPERAIYLLRQICGSLGEAHERGIVHRDIKPSNIFVTRRGGLCDFVKVLDFGLARKLEDGGDSKLTKTGMIFGTPRYIAPESIVGAQTADARSDLYNLGGVAYWLLTGQQLFGSSSSVDLLIDHVKTVPEPPSAVTELPIPEALDRIVMRCLEKDPEDRFQTADDLVAALEAVPVEPRWSQERAREWWAAHGPEAVPEPMA